MTWKAWLILVLFLLWSGGSWYWYTCEVKGFCPGEQGWSGSTTSDNDLVEQATPTLISEADSSKLDIPASVLAFGWGSLTPDTAIGWNDEIQLVIDSSVPGKVLEITAPYQLNEGETDLGVVRAQAIKNLLAMKLDTTGILTKGRVVETAPKDSLYQLADISFRWIRNDRQVRELADGALIYFPYKSDERIDDPSINQYLKELAKAVRDGSKTIEVIGHTDDKGSAGYNLKLGQERADAIKSLLVELGVPAERIIASSKGESEPLAPNISDENKAKNRRTEIKVK